MAQRTNALAVQTLLGTDYDNINCPSLKPRIDSAVALIDRVVTCATNKGIPLTAAEAELLERWMAAHFYTKTDPVYQSRSTAGASGSFVRGSKEPEPYKDAALSLDPSGCLNALLNRQRADSVWLGKTQSEKVAYEDRN